MHGDVRWVHRARRKAGKNVGPEDSEPEEESDGEMEHFQDLQLGSITPVVRHGYNSLRLSHRASLQDMDRLFVL